MHAVITGDLVGSSRVTARGDFLGELKSALHWVEVNYAGEHDIYRGDSFQVDIPSPKNAIRAAILIRSHLIATSPDAKKRGWDARVSIGIGRNETQEGKVKERDGQAFILSGRGLDEITKSGARLTIKTPSEDVDSDLALLTRFTDEIISNWSHYSAELAFYYLFTEMSQLEIGKKLLGLTQPTIHGRISTAKLKLTDLYIEKVQDVLKRNNWL